MTYEIWNGSSCTILAREIKMTGFPYCSYIFLTLGLFAPFLADKDALCGIRT